MTLKAFEGTNVFVKSIGCHLNAFVAYFGFLTPALFCELFKLTHYLFWLFLTKAGFSEKKLR